MQSSPACSPLLCQPTSFHCWLHAWHTRSSFKECQGQGTHCQSAMSCPLILKNSWRTIKSTCCLGTHSPTHQQHHCSSQKESYNGNENGRWQHCNQWKEKHGCVWTALWSDIWQPLPCWPNHTLRHPPMHSSPWSQLSQSPSPLRKSMLPSTNWKLAKPLASMALCRRRTKQWIANPDGTSLHMSLPAWRQCRLWRLASKPMFSCPKVRKPLWLEQMVRCHADGCIQQNLLLCHECPCLPSPQITWHKISVWRHLHLRLPRWALHPQDTPQRTQKPPLTLLGSQLPQSLIRLWLSECWRTIHIVSATSPDEQNDHWTYAKWMGAWSPSSQWPISTNIRLQAPY